MGKFLLIQLCLMLIYISYKSIICAESPIGYQQEGSSNPSGFAKFNLKDMMNLIEDDRKDDFRFSKRSKSNSMEDPLIVDQIVDPAMYDTEASVDEILRTNPLLLQMLADKLKNQQNRFLSPRLGRTTEQRHMPSLPPRFGKRTGSHTIFTPRMG
ncbi:uncharacterized protein LOC134827252 [Culicoides brevitarsis]|uniref:uncharacterized protein LOC134827252 n=1 Tax=Culicoides brevitarsis TaxID=469753 RepID=UPI00307C16CC